jgi:hypothetical protein
MALGSTQPLTEMSTRNLPGGKERQARKADNLTAICEPIVYKMWGPQRLQPYGPSRPITRIVLPFFTFNNIHKNYKFWSSLMRNCLRSPLTLCYVQILP